jgi:hypothetical protein
VSWGPGLRWGVMGPNLLFHLGGGPGGIQHFMEHLSGPLAGWWKDLGSFTDWPSGAKQAIVEGIALEAGVRSLAELTQTRDDDLLGLLKIRSKNQASTSKAKAS